MTNFVEASKAKGTRQEEVQLTTPFIDIQQEPSKQRKRKKVDDI